MKKYFFTLVSIIILLTIIISPSLKVSAVTPSASPNTDYNYYRIENNNVFLYSAPLASPDYYIFEIPKGYFVKVTGSAENFHTVEYGSVDSYIKIVGYVIKQEVVKTSIEPPLYLSHFIQATSNTKLLETQKATSKIISSVLSGQGVYYYGTLKLNSQTLYFVKFNNDLGYVDSKSFEPLNTSAHPMPIPTAIPLPTKAPDKNQSTKFTESRDILLIIASAAPLLLFIILIFKPKNNDDYFE